MPYVAQSLTRDCGFASRLRPVVCVTVHAHFQRLAATYLMRRRSRVVGTRGGGIEAGRAGDVGVAGSFGMVLGDGAADTIGVGDVDRDGDSDIAFSLFSSSKRSHNDLGAGSTISAISLSISCTNQRLVYSIGPATQTNIPFFETSRNRAFSASRLSPSKKPSFSSSL